METPLKQLAGFTKVSLEPGEQKLVEIELDSKSLSYWDEEVNKWMIPKGKVPIYVGASSQDIRLEGQVTMLRAK